MLYPHPFSTLASQVGLSLLVTMDINDILDFYEDDSEDLMAALIWRACLQTVKEYIHREASLGGASFRIEMVARPLPENRFSLPETCTVFTSSEASGEGRLSLSLHFSDLVADRFDQAEFRLSSGEHAEVFAWVKPNKVIVSREAIARALAFRTQ